MNNVKEEKCIIDIKSERDFLHRKNEPCTNKYLKRPLVKLLKGVQAQRVLDIGCGSGTLDKYLIEAGINIIGVDPSDDGIEKARTLLPNTKFYQLGVYDSPALIEEENFDVVLSTEVIEHLYYPRKLVEFAKAKLSPGGYLLITTPYHGYLKNLSLSLAGKWDYHHCPHWDGGHIKFWSKRTLSLLVEEQNFTVVKIVGIGRIPYLWRHMALLCQLR